MAPSRERWAYDERDAPYAAPARYRSPPFRLLHRRADTHWLVHGEAPFQRVIVRQFHPRYGGPSGSESRQWEQTLADTLRAPVGPFPSSETPQLVDGRWYGIYEVRQGKPVSKDEQGYFWLGQQLARLHLTMESIDLDERLTRQRPGWGSSTEGDRPRFRPRRRPGSHRTTRNHRLEPRGAPRARVRPVTSSGRRDEPDGVAFRSDSWRLCAVEPPPVRRANLGSLRLRHESPGLSTRGSSSCPARSSRSGRGRLCQRETPL